MKRYWVFAGERCYPGGGMNDFQLSTDSFAEAAERAKELYETLNRSSGSWFHIWDMVENKKIPGYEDYE